MDEVWNKVTYSIYDNAPHGDVIKVGYVFTDLKSEPMHAGENWYSGKFWEIKECTVGPVSVNRADRQHAHAMTFIGSRIWADGEILYEPVDGSELPRTRIYR